MLKILQDNVFSIGPFKIDSYLTTLLSHNFSQTKKYRNQLKHFKTQKQLSVQSLQYKQIWYAKALLNQL